MNQLRHDTIISVKKLASRSWEYTLYEVNDQYWVIFIPYSPKSYVDASMGILLTAQERANIERDDQWLIQFSQLVRESYRNYLSRALDPETMAVLRQHL